jgi:hypothetical protein
VDVQEEENKSDYLKFLNNCAVLTVDEGYVEADEIVSNLQMLFDKNWQWHLRELEEFKYLVRFPPHKQISNAIISDTTYFKLKKEGVRVSLMA